jgi:hypothetical protein
MAKKKTTPKKKSSPSVRAEEPLKDKEEGLTQEEFIERIRKARAAKAGVDYQPSRPQPKKKGPSSRSSRHSIQTFLLPLSQAFRPLTSRYLPEPEKDTCVVSRKTVRDAFKDLSLFPVNHITQSQSSESVVRTMHSMPTSQQSSSQRVRSL